MRRMFLLVFLIVALGCPVVFGYSPVSNVSKYNTEVEGCAVEFHFYRNGPNSPILTIYFRPTENILYAPDKDQQHNLKITTDGGAFMSNFYSSHLPEPVRHAGSRERRMSSMAFDGMGWRLDRAYATTTSVTIEIPIVTYEGVSARDGTSRMLPVRELGRFNFKVTLPEDIVSEWRAIMSRS